MKIHYYNKKEFWNKVTYISLLSACMIVIMHTINNTVDKFNNSPLSTDLLNNIHFLTRNAVKLFWMISALLFYRDYNLSKVKQKYRSRFKSLVIPYLIWNIIGVIFTYIIYSVPSLKEQVNGLELFSPSFNNIIEGVFHYKYNIIFWYIFELILLTILSPIIYISLYDKYIGLVVLIIFYTFSPNLFENQNIIRGGESWIYYLIAAYISIHYFNKTLIKLNNTQSILCFILFLLFNFIQIEVLSNRFLSLLITVIQCVLMWLSTDFMTKFSRKWMIGISMFIYAIHFNIDMGISKIVTRTIPDIPEISIVAFIICLFLTITISIYTAVFLRNYTPKIYLLLNGNR